MFENLCEISHARFNRDVIYAEHQRLGYGKEWSFMATPDPLLHKANVALIGINPGRGAPNDHYTYQGLWDFQGNAYFDEK